MPALLKNHKQARLIVVGDGGLYWPLRVYARYLLLEYAIGCRARRRQGPARAGPRQRRGGGAEPVRHAVVADRPPGRRAGLVATTRPPRLLDHEKGRRAGLTPAKTAWCGASSASLRPRSSPEPAANGRKKLDDGSAGPRWPARSRNGRLSTLASAPVK